MNPTQDILLPYFRAMGLEQFLLDPDVSEIMITAGRAFVEKNGAMQEVPDVRIEDKVVRNAVETIGYSIGNQIDDSRKPWLDSRLPDGSRVAAAYPPISPNGVILTIRKFLRHFTISELWARHAVDNQSIYIIKSAVRDRKNILISGGTSTGKTTILNAFAREIPLHERILSIEEPIEMKLDHRNAVRLEAYPAIGDRPAVTVSQLLSLALRHRPDRIIVGEVKDFEAARGLLQAMNTGHDGTFSTIHSNTGVRALYRLASLAMLAFGNLDLARQETADAIDMVVEVRKTRDGWRGVNAIYGVGDYDDRSRKFETEEVYRRA
jgi:pilus assembly protein CpaF